jgi:predicted PurR-regulated permease PerM
LEHTVDKAGIVAAAIGFSVFRFLPPDLTAMFLGGAVAGACCAIVPLLVSRLKGTQLAAHSILVCVIAGMIGGVVLAIPAALVMSLVAYFRKPPEPEQAAGTFDSQNRR